MAAADWSEFPWDLLNRLVSRFGIPHDFTRFKSVCSSWRSFAAAQEQLLFRPRSTSTPPQFFGLMLLRDRRDCTYFYSPLDDKVYRNLLHVPCKNNHFCRGSRDGWLLALSFSRKHVCLWNSLSRHILPMVRFPSLTSLFEIFPWDISERNWKEIVQCVQDEVLEFLQKIVLSANPTDQTATDRHGLTMIIIFGHYYRLAYAKEGAKAWVVVQDDHVRGRLYDIIYYSDGFYGVDGLGTIFFVDINCSVPTVREVMSHPPYSYYDHPLLYLVESYDGKLFLVSGAWVEVHGEVDDWEEDTHMGDWEEGYKTVKYCWVHQLDLKNQEKIQIRDLGDQSLFLGFNSSLSIPSPEKFGLRKNCIYFATGYNIGLFDLGTDNFESFYSLRIFKNGAKPVWITL